MKRGRGRPKDSKNKKQTPAWERHLLAAAREVFVTDGHMRVLRHRARKEEEAQRQRWKEEHANARKKMAADHLAWAQDYLANYKGPKPGESTQRHGDQTEATMYWIALAAVKKLSTG